MKIKDKIKKMKDHKFNDKIYSAAIAVLFFVSIIPLVILCFYNHPAADDYNYSIQTYHTWNDTHSIGRVLYSAFQTTLSFWNYWQGLYSSAFFQALQPAIFGEQFYALAGIAMLIIIIGSTCFFSAFLTKEIMQGSLLDGIAMGCAASFVMIQQMPSLVEGLYWYNGAINYGLFYAILLFFICSMVNLHRDAKQKKLRNIFACCMFLFLLEGGNHVTAFMGLLFSAAVLVIEIIKKNKPQIIRAFLILMFGAACFYLNVSSPGTKVRSASLEGYRMGAFDSIKNAVRGGMRNIGSWTDFSLAIVIILIMPLVVKNVRKFCRVSDFSFRFPFLVSLGSVGWICAMYTPPLYAMGYMGEGRLNNVVYYSFVLLLFVNVFYVTGHFIRRHASVNTDERGVGITASWSICAACLVIGFIIARWDYTWSAQALDKLKWGEPQWYSQQAYERNRLLLDSAGQDVTVSEYTVKPGLIYFDDITEDADDWRNVSVRQYFDLDSIALERME